MNGAAVIQPAPIPSIQFWYFILELWHLLVGTQDVRRIILAISLY